MALDFVTVVLTTRCNMRCSYCLLRRDERRAAPWPTLRAALDRVLPLAPGDLTIQLTGGEPLIAWPLLLRVVAHASLLRRARGVRWKLVTNGLLLDEKAVAFLDAHGFEVTVSLDGVAEAQDGRLPGSWSRLDRLLDRLRREHPSFFARLTVAMTVSPSAIPHLARSLAYLVSLRLPRLTIKAAVPGAGWKPEDIGVLERQYAAFVTALSAVRRDTGQPLFVLPVEQPYEPNPARAGWTCGAGLGQALTIDVDGRIFGCAVAAGSFQPATAPAFRRAVDALALGPVDAEHLDARLAALPDRARACGAFTHPDQRYSSYRRCRDCEHLGRCYACPLAAASVPGWDDVRRVPDFVCAWNQVTLAARDGSSVPVS